MPDQYHIELKESISLVVHAQCKVLLALQPHA